MKRPKAGYVIHDENGMDATVARPNSVRQFAGVLLLLGALPLAVAVGGNWILGLEGFQGPGNDWLWFTGALSCVCGLLVGLGATLLRRR